MLIELILEALAWVASLLAKLFAIVFWLVAWSFYGLATCIQRDDRGKNAQIPPSPSRRRP